MKDIAISLEKFNKSVHPFIVKRYRKEVSFIPYVEAVNYLMALHERIVKATDLTDVVIDEDGLDRLKQSGWKK